MKVIVSVSDKTDIVDFARALAKRGDELYATGNTLKALQEAGVAAWSVSDLTGFPEILDGRVKTLHPAIHAGILARRDLPEHLFELSTHQLELIDMVVCNLYPFQQTISKGDATQEEALEQIDIGGPTLLRAAAKNFPFVLPVVSPADYGPVLAALQAGEVSQELRRQLAAETFQHVASYDTAVAAYLRGEEDLFPAALTLALSKKQDLRYGENPHQRGALYALDAGQSPIVTAQQIGGKGLSYVNVLDADAAWSAACEFDQPTVVIVKHTTPCGIASRDSLVEAFGLAFEADPISAFGGIIAVNRMVDAALAGAIRRAKHPTSGERLFVEIVVATGFSLGAIEILGKAKDLRLLKARPVEPHVRALEFRGVVGGMLIQDADRLAEDDPPEMRVVSSRPPTAAEEDDLRFAWHCVKAVKSNAVVLVKERVMIGAGTGQTNRVESARLALKQAGERAAGAVSASDAMIPFADTVEVCAAAGVSAIIQTGGSIRDRDSIQVCDAHQMAMVTTGIRHFRH